MSKRKKFTPGLESLFEHIALEEKEAVNPLLRKPKERAELSPAEPDVAQERKEFEEAPESFANSLDDLFKQDLNEAVLDKVEQARTKAKRQSRRKQGVRGLDSLIRDTLRNERVEMEMPSAKERVTFVFDKEKLDKLKDIARMEKTYLKDIISEVVQEFIEEYDKNQR